MLEIWLTLGFLALVTSLLSSGGKRLGDIFAGTFVITERLPGQRGTTAPMSALPPALAAWAATAELSGLTDATAETARQYLSRYYDFTPATREEFGRGSRPPWPRRSPRRRRPAPARPTTCPRCSPSAASAPTPGCPPRPAPPRTRPTRRTAPPPPGACPTRRLPPGPRQLAAARARPARLLPPPVTAAFLQAPVR